MSCQDQVQVFGINLPIWPNDTTSDSVNLLLTVLVEMFCCSTDSKVGAPDICSDQKIYLENSYKKSM